MEHFQVFIFLLSSIFGGLTLLLMLGSGTRKESTPFPKWECVNSDSASTTAGKTCNKRWEKEQGKWRGAGCKMPSSTSWIHFVDWHASCYDLWSLQHEEKGGRGRVETWDATGINMWLDGWCLERLWLSDRHSMLVARARGHLVTYVWCEAGIYVCKKSAQAGISLVALKSGNQTNFLQPNLIHLNQTKLKIFG